MGIQMLQTPSTCTVFDPLYAWAHLMKKLKALLAINALSGPFAFIL
jgi:hypothetical protein